MAIVKLMLRTGCAATDNSGEIITNYFGCVMRVRPTHDEIDLDRLSPRARELAKAIADLPHASADEIKVESDLPIRDLIPEWRTWYTEEQAARPLCRRWGSWSRFTATDPNDPHEWLERQAAKIPAGWHVAIRR